LSYKEPHLQKKSDECAELWREWFSLFETRDPDDYERIEARKVWCKCCDEFSEMVHQEFLTNSKYNNLRM